MVGTDSPRPYLADEHDGGPNSSACPSNLRIPSTPPTPPTPPTPHSPPYDMSAHNVYTYTAPMKMSSGSSTPQKTIRPRANTLATCDTASSSINGHGTPTSRSSSTTSTSHGTSNHPVPRSPVLSTRERIAAGIHVAAEGIVTSMPPQCQFPLSFAPSPGKEAGNTHNITTGTRSSTTSLHHRRRSSVGLSSSSATRNRKECRGLADPNQSNHDKIVPMKADDPYGDNDGSSPPSSSAERPSPTTICWGISSLFGPWTASSRAIGMLDEGVQANEELELPDEDGGGSRSSSRSRSRSSSIGRKKKRRGEAAEAAAEAQPTSSPGEQGPATTETEGGVECPSDEDPEEHHPPDGTVKDVQEEETTPSRTERVYDEILVDDDTAQGAPSSSVPTSPNRPRQGERLPSSSPPPPPPPSDDAGCNDAFLSELYSAANACSFDSIVGGIQTMMSAAEDDDDREGTVPVENNNTEEGATVSAEGKAAPAPAPAGIDNIFHRSISDGLAAASEQLCSIGSGILITEGDEEEDQGTISIPAVAEQDPSGNATERHRHLRYRERSEELPPRPPSRQAFLQLQQQQQHQHQLEQQQLQEQQEQELRKQREQEQGEERDRLLDEAARFDLLGDHSTALACLQRCLLPLPSPPSPAERGNNGPKHKRSDVVSNLAVPNLLAEHTHPPAGPYQTSVGRFQLIQADSAQADIFHKMGIIHWKAGSYNEALQKVNAALAIYRQTLLISPLATTTLIRGVPDDEVQENIIESRYVQENHDADILADVLNSIGRVYFSLGDYSQAMRHFAEALAVQTDVYASADVDALRQQSVATPPMIGRADADGDATDALDLAPNPSYESCELSPGANDSGRSLMSGSTANTAMSPSSPPCSPSSVGSRKKRKAAIGHPGVARTTICMGMVHEARGRHRKAMRFYKDGLRSQRLSLGNHHVDLAATLNAVGSLYEKTGDYDLSMHCFEEALGIYKENLGPGHPDVAVTLNNIGQVQFQLRKYDEAMSSYTQALSILRTSLGDSHRNVAATMHNMGLVYTARKQHGDALKIFRTVLNLQRAALGDDHFDVAVTLDSVASAYEGQARYPKAGKFYTKALRVRRVALGKEHIFVALTLHRLGTFHLEKDYNYGEAVRRLEEAKRVYEANAVEEADVRIVEVMSKLNDARSLLRDEEDRINF